MLASTSLLHVHFKAFLKMLIYVIATPHPAKTVEKGEVMSPLTAYGA